MATGNGAIVGVRPGGDDHPVEPIENVSSIDSVYINEKMYTLEDTEARTEIANHIQVTLSQNTWDIEENTSGTSLGDGIDNWGNALAELLLLNTEGTNSVKNGDDILMFDRQRYKIDNICKYWDAGHSPNNSDIEYMDFFITCTLQHVPRSLEFYAEVGESELKAMTDCSVVKLIRYNDDHNHMMHTYFYQKNDKFGEEDGHSSKSY